MFAPVRAIRIGTSERVEHAVPCRRVRPSVREYGDLARFAVGDDWLSKREASEAAVRDWLLRRGIAVAKITPDYLLGKDLKWADAVVHDLRATVEFKELRTATVRAMDGALTKAGKQSRHVIVDARASRVDLDTARSLLLEAMGGDDSPGQYIDQIIVILEGEGIAPLEWFRG